MPKMYICDTVSHGPEDGKVIDQRSELFPTLDAAVEGEYICPVDGSTWGVEFHNLRRYPNWEFIRVVSPDTNEASLALLEKNEELPHFRVSRVMRPMTPVYEPPVEDFKPAEKTPVPERRPVSVFGNVDPRDFSRKPKRKKPSKILILCQEDLAHKLRGTLFSSTGKSLRTAGRNPLVMRAKELSPVARSSKPVGCIEIPRSKLEDWDAPDIMDDFLLVVFAEDENPLPACEGDLNLFTFSPDDLDDLEDLYAFLSLKME